MRRAIRSVLAALCLLVLPSSAWAQAVPDDYMPTADQMPIGFVAQRDARSGQGQGLERWYFRDVDGAMFHLISVAAGSPDGAVAACWSASDALRRDGYTVESEMIDGRPGMVAAQRVGLLTRYAAYTVAGSACLGVIASGPEDLVSTSLPAILRTMAARATV